MKRGDTLTIEHLPYTVVSLFRGIVTLKRQRRTMTLHKFTVLLKTKRWRRPSVSANFLVDRVTKEAIDNHQMLALGIPSKRIERLHATLPLLGGFK